MTTKHADKLEQLLKGLAWLGTSQKVYVEGAQVKHIDDDFGRILEECILLEVDLRSGGFQGCIYGAGPCPVDGIMICDHCIGKIQSMDQAWDALGPSQSAKPKEGQQQMFSLHRRD
ncbi:MAG: hypothetical protein IH919_07825 [Deltaproteobacteria bacterium]|nr:hypothetical protein [Deltaproteobacteria bacterium]